MMRLVGHCWSILGAGNYGKKKNISLRIEEKDSVGQVGKLK